MNGTLDSIPHCNTKKLEDGIEVSFRKMPSLMKKTILETMDKQNRVGHGRNSPGVLFVIGLGLNLLIKLMIATLYWAWLLVFPTRIRIGSDSVAVAGKSIPRAQFGGFVVVQPQQTLDTTGRSSEAVASLGYRVGHQTVKFGGSWKEYQARDVAAALNSYVGIAA